MKQTEIGLIPEDWEVQKLGDHFQLKARIGWQGLTTAEYLESGDYYLVTGTDFKNGYIDWDNCVNVEKSRYDQDRFIQLKVGDVLVTKDGTIGKVAFVDKLIKLTTLNSGVFVLRSKNTNIDNQFMYYILMSFYFDDFLKKITAGSTINHLYQKDFIHFKFVVPSLPQQQTIAKALSHSDKWIEKIEKLITKKKAIKIGAMHQLFTAKNNWNVKKLSEISQVIRGASPRPIENPIWFDYKSSIGWVRISDVTKSDKYLKETVQKLSEAGIKNSRFVKSESLIMSICATIGKPVITEIDVCIHDGFVVFSDLKVDKNYLYNYFKFIEQEWSKNGQTGSQMNLNTSIINSTEVLFPNSINEQVHIATILSDIDSEISILQNNLLKARQLKLGMMQHLLAGEVILSDTSKGVIEISTPMHNEHFEDAILIGVLAHCFATPNFPLTRFKYTKVSYLLKRYKKHQTEGYLKKAAGPYKPQTRYDGAEKIALTKDYVTTHKASYKGKEFEGFVPGSNTAEALNYFKDWFGTDSMTWMEQFKFEKNDHLELWATVDMAIEELKNENKIVNVASIKQVLKANKKWQAKLTRPIFSDESIQKAIIKLDTLFH